MRNPFNYSSIVTGKDFCGREQECADIIRHINNSNNLLMFSKRKFGKTSLISEIFENRLPDSTIRIYADMFDINNETDFIKNLAAGISAANLNKDIKTRLKELTKILPRISFSVKPDADTGLKFTPDIRHADFETQFTDIFEGLYEYGKSSGRKICVVIDEFQQISEIPYKGLEAKIRSHVQFHDNISYIFTGSKSHMLTDFISDTKRPFYGILTPFELSPIPEDVFYEFVQKKFAEHSVKLTQEVFQKIYEISRGETRYVIKVCHYLFSSGRKKINIPDIDKTVSFICRENDSLWRSFFDVLTPNQRIVLKMISNGLSTLTSKDALAKYSISASSVYRAAESLIDKTVILKDAERFLIYDVEFMHWLRCI